MAKLGAVARARPYDAAIMTDFQGSDGALRFDLDIRADHERDERPTPDCVRLLARWHMRSHRPDIVNWPDRRTR